MVIYIYFDASIMDDWLLENHEWLSVFSKFDQIHNLNIFCVLSFYT